MYQYSLSRLFCLKVPETFLGETFCAVFHKKFPVAKKFKDKRGVGASGFSVAFCLSHSTKNFR